MCASGVGEFSHTGHGKTGRQPRSKTMAANIWADMQADGYASRQERQQASQRGRRGAAALTGTLVRVRVGVGGAVDGDV
jgi:hypothetical protein